MAAGTVKTRTIAGRTFRCSNRTARHLRWTLWVLALRHPKARLQIIQACYSDPRVYIYSAGTHDYDAVFDVEIAGMGWWDAQRFLRRRGWAAWYRHTGTWADQGNWHIHMVSLPPGLPANPTPLQIGKAYAALGIKVGKYVDGGYSTTGSVVGTSQVDDYYAHALGLKGQHRAGDDYSWFPDSINKTVFRRRWWTQRVTGGEGT